MGIQVVWDNAEKTIIRYIFDEQWTWEEFFAAKKEAYTQIDSVPHKVGVILDAPANTTLPPNMLTHARSAFQNRHPNTEVLVFVTTKVFLRTMINTFAKLSKGANAGVQLVSTLDEARKVVIERLNIV